MGILQESAVTNESRYGHLHPQIMANEFVGQLAVNDGPSLRKSVARVIERSFLHRESPAFILYDIKEASVLEAIAKMQIYKPKHLEFSGDQEYLRNCGEEQYHMANSVFLRQLYGNKLIIITYESPHIGTLNDISTRVHSDPKQRANNNYLEKIPLVLLKNRVE